MTVAGDWLDAYLFVLYGPLGSTRFSAQVCNCGRLELCVKETLSQLYCVSALMKTPGQFKLLLSHITKAETPAPISCRRQVRRALLCLQIVSANAAEVLNAELVFLPCQSDKRPERGNFWKGARAHLATVPCERSDV